MTIKDKKSKLRKQMLFKRSQFSKTIKSKYDLWICQSLLQIIEENQFKAIHCYLPMGTEINVTALIETLLEQGLTVVSPKTLPKRKLKNLILNSLEDLEKGVFGTVHPAGSNEYQGEYDLIIVPGLAFDQENYRLGYGGAYYDTFLVNHPNAKKVGIFYPFQEVENIPIEPHDIQLDQVLVNKGLA